MREHKEILFRNFYGNFCRAIPDYPVGRIWTNNKGEILCKDQVSADTIADLLEILYKKHEEVCLKATRGYYAKLDKNESNAGWYFVDFPRDIEYVSHPVGEWTNYFRLFHHALPRQPEGRIWSDGSMILCKSGSAAETIADLLKYLYHNQWDEIIAKTGYYDPAEDREEKDRYTGWYYVAID